MKKEVFDNILRVICNNFPYTEVCYKQVVKALAEDEKTCLENFQPYVKNLNYHRLTIKEDDLTIKTVSDGSALTFHVRELPLDWTQNKKTRTLTSFFDDYDNKLYHIKVELKDSKDGWYLEEEYSLWDSELGDYQYIGRNQSREFGYYEIQDFFTDQTKLNNETKL